jgi:Glycosyltransferase family 87
VAALLLSLVPLYPLGVVAWSGNLNALLAPALTVVWLAFNRQRTVSADFSLGVIVGLAAALKLGPVILLWWLITQRRWSAVVVAAVTIALVLGATAMLGGTRTFADYVQLLGSAGAAPSPLSLPGLAIQLGLDPIVGYGAIVVIAAMTGLLMLAIRDRPGVTFALAVLLSLIVVTIVRVETLVVGIAALAPWATHRFAASTTFRVPSLRMGVAVIAAFVALAGVVASVATGGLAPSGMALRNDSTEPVIVRFTVPGQYATFGYRLAPDDSGVGWANELGADRGRLVVYTADCQFLYDTTATSSGVGWSLGATAATDLSAEPSAQFLPYDSTCARELRARREGGP